MAVGDFDGPGDGVHAKRTGKVLNPPGEKKPPFMKTAKKPDDKAKLAKSEAAQRRLQLLKTKGKGK